MFRVREAPGERPLQVERGVHPHRRRRRARGRSTSAGITRTEGRAGVHGTAALPTPWPTDQ